VSGLGPTLETARLILRPLAPEDFEPWAAMAADPEVTRHLGGVQPRSVAWRGFMTMAGAWAMQGAANFSVIEKASGIWIGRLGPWQPDGWPGTEIGWTLARQAWGKGYATEGAAAAMDWVVDHLGWTEIVHCIEAENTASQAVARRLGSTILRRQALPEPYAHVISDVWGQSAEAWRARRADRV
jgi:RimJ/RimL family protein N-acetyltransferase